MAINYNLAKEKFTELADQLITDVNATPMVLFYNTDTTISVTGDNLSPLGYDFLGGRTSFNDMESRSNESGANRAEVVASGAITVRAYWKNIKNDVNASIKDSKDICKIICFTTDAQKLLNAKYAVVNDRKISMVKDSLPHGLFGDKRYSTSYWEIID